MVLKQFQNYDTKILSVSIILSTPCFYEGHSVYIVKNCLSSW